METQPAGPLGIEREKQIAAEAAAELVESGMTVGLGTGSTVAFLLPALAPRSLDILCAATSPRRVKAWTRWPRQAATCARMCAAAPKP